MEIHGIQKLTLLDYPGHTACTVFLGRCNYRCPFCHNASLVLHPNDQPGVESAELFTLLERRRGLLDGVCITGGEPTLQRDLPELCAEIRERGFLVKLDTNGTNPAMLASLTERGLVDYVAMDIKNSPERYPQTVGRQNLDLTPIRESAAFLLSGAVDYEFRTTVVREFHDGDCFRAIGAWIEGAKQYYLQAFVARDTVLQPGLSACTGAEMEHFAHILRPFVPNVALRGVDPEQK